MERDHLGKLPELWESLILDGEVHYVCDDRKKFLFGQLDDVGINTIYST